MTAGYATLVSMDDLPVPDRAAAKRMAMALFTDEAIVRGANRVTLQHVGAHAASWTYSGG